MLSFSNIVLIITALVTALIAGLFYAYSCSVNPGLGKLPDEQYLAAMQSINKAILNPLFFISFMGTLLLLPVSTFMSYGQPLSMRFWCLLTATIVYGIGTFGVTMFGNVPLNDSLEKFDVANATVDAINAQRLAFEKPWNSFHTVRTLASAAAIVLVIIACLNNQTSASK